MSTTSSSASGAQAVIIDAVRTPIGRAGKGSLVEVRPDDLGAFILRSLLDRVGGGVETSLDEVICGCGFPWGEQGYNVGRTIALLARLEKDVPAFTITRLCASSLQAIRSAQHAIQVGEGASYAIVGVESCSRVGRDRHLAEHNPLLDPHMPGPTFADIYLPMIETAENVASKYGVSRREMDLFALQSQQRALAARDSGVLENEIVPVPLPNGSLFTRDEGPRPGTTLETLSALPALLPDAGGRLTAGNSCALNDGAVSVLVMARDRADELGLSPRARIVASGVAAVDPANMGVGPIEAVSRAFTSSGLALSDMDTVEINEAFASQVVAVAREIGLDPADERLNPHGGAIAIGHPFGMSGARLVTAAINALEQRDGHFGLVTLCVGGGQGQAMILERV
ncbi:MAG TPA: thiolase family protein [Acidimicrobiales bacterium]|nr:thiolase family protein [Acidimicrobiales bacterium]